MGQVLLACGLYRSLWHIERCGLLDPGFGAWLLVLYDREKLLFHINKLRLGISAFQVIIRIQSNVLEVRPTVLVGKMYLALTRHC